MSAWSWFTNTASNIAHNVSSAVSGGGSSNSGVSSYTSGGQTGAPQASPPQPSAPQNPFQSPLPVGIAAPHTSANNQAMMKPPVDHPGSNMQGSTAYGEGNQPAAGTIGPKNATFYPETPGGAGVGKGILQMFTGGEPGAASHAYVDPKTGTVTPAKQASVLGGLQGLLGTAMNGASHVPLVGPVMKGIGRGWTDLISHPASDLISMYSKTQYDMMTGKSPLYDVLNESTWVKSWQASNHISPGQAFQVGFNNSMANIHIGDSKVIDPLNEQAVADHFSKDHVGANLQSGTLDFILGAAASKGIGAVGKVPALLRDKPIGDSGNIEKAMSSKGMQRLQSQVEDARANGNGAAQIANMKALQAVGPHKSAIAAALATAKPEQINTILRVAVGDTKSIDALAAQGDAAAANRVAQMLSPAQIAEQMAFSSEAPVGDWMKTVAQAQAKSAGIALADSPEQAQHWLGFLGQMTTRTTGDLLGSGPAALKTAKQFATDAKTGTRAPARALNEIPTDDLRMQPDQAAPVFRPNWFDVPTRIYQSLTDKPSQALINFTDGTAADSIRSWLNKSQILSPEFKLDMYNRVAEAKPGELQGIWDHLEGEAVPTQLAQHYGITTENLHDIVATSRNLARQQAANIGDKAYGVVSSPAIEGGSSAAIHTGDEIISNKVYETQLQSGAVPQLNLRHLETVLDHMDQTGKLHTIMKMGSADVQQLMQTVYGVWKPLVLMTMHRAYNHIGDDYLRSVAKLGALSMAGDAVEGTGNFMRNRLQKFTHANYIGNIQGQVEKAHNDANAVLNGLKAQAKDQQARITFGAKIDPENMVTQSVLDDAQRRVDLARGDLENFVTNKDAIIQPKNRVGTGESFVKGTNLRMLDAFGGPNADWLRANISAHTSYGALMVDAADRDYAQMLGDMHKTGNHIAIYPQMPNVAADKALAAHAQAWVKTVNNHMRQSPLAKVFMNPQATLKDGLDFLKTPAGKVHLDNLGLSPANAEGLANDVFKLVHTALPNPAMRGRALFRPVSTKDLQNWFPNAAQRPPVAGEEGLLAFGKHPGQNRLQQVTQKLLKLTGSLPDDIIVRHPVYNAFYKVHRDNLVKSAAAQRGITVEKLSMMPDEVDRLTRTAHQLARKDLVGMVYDTSRFNDAGSVLRFVSPFFNAWYNAMSSWGRLFKDNPALLVDATRIKHGIWNNPYMVDKTTGQRSNDDTPLADLAFVGHMPKGLAKVLGSEQLSTIPISMSTIISPTYADSVGNPGFGPLVQIPADQIAKSNPGFALSDVYDKISGGRITANSLQSIIPSGVSDLMNTLGMSGVTGSGGSTDQSVAKTAWAIYQGQMYDFQTGHRSSEPNWNDVMKQAKITTGIDMFVNRLSPLGFKPTGSYTFFTDEYKRLLTADPTTAKQKFADLYGEQAMIFTQSLDKNVAGVNATAGALTLYKKYQSDISKSPDLASVIIGPEGNGNYSAQALQWEFANGLRQQMSPQDAAKQSKTEQGYYELSKIIAYEQATLHDRGLKSINQKGAEDLKKDRADWLAQQADPNSKYYNPDFYSAYGSFNQNAYNVRIQGLEKVANDPNLLNNPLRSDIQSLNKYFQARDFLVANLAKQPSQSLTAASNSDWANWWDYVVGTLKSDDTKFGPLYERYLKHDNFKVGTTKLTNKASISDIPMQ